MLILIQYVCEVLRLCLLLLNMQELHSRAQGELSIREALKELELWGSKATFTLSPFENSQLQTVQIIKGWSDVIQEVSTC